MTATRCALILALGVWLSCASGGLPVTRYYTLTASADLPGSSSGQPAGQVDSAGALIAVEPLKVATPYDQDRLVHRASAESTEVGFYHYHRWAAPLGRLVQASLLTNLDGASGVAGLRLSGSGQAGAVLGGRVLHVEEIDGPRPRVRVAFKLALRSSSNEELWHGAFAGEEPGSFSDGTEVAAAIARIFDRLLGEARAALELGLAGLESAG